MRAAGFRPATPALAQMLQISTDHACDAVGQHTPVGLPSPQSLLLSSTIDATGRCSQDLPGRHQASNRHRARCGRVLSLPRLRALQVCRRRPTLGVAPIPHGRHPQTFTESELAPRIGELLAMRSLAKRLWTLQYASPYLLVLIGVPVVLIALVRGRPFPCQWYATLFRPCGIHPSGFRVPT